MTTLYTFVTGPAGSGKSSFLQSLGAPDHYWIDEEAHVEMCRLDVEDADEPLEIYLFCPIEAARFDSLLAVQQRDLLGYIVMVDSTDSDSWEEAKFTLENCR